MRNRHKSYRHFPPSFDTTAVIIQFTRLRGKCRPNSHYLLIRTIEWVPSSIFRHHESLIRPRHDRKPDQMFATRIGRLCIARLFNPIQPNLQPPLRIKLGHHHDFTSTVHTSPKISGVAHDDYHPSTIMYLLARRFKVHSMHPDFPFPLFPSAST